MANPADLCANDGLAHSLPPSGERAAVRLLPAES